MTSEKWLTIDELAELMNVKRSWVRDKVTARVLPHRRPAGGVRFAPEDVEAIKQQLFEPAVAATPSRAAGRVRRATRRPAANAA